MKNFIELCNQALEHPLVKGGLFRHEIEELKQDWIQGIILPRRLSMGFYIISNFDDGADQGLYDVIKPVERFYQMRLEGKNWQELVE